MVSGRENSTLLLAAQLDCQAKESPDYEYPEKQKPHLPM